MELVFKGKHYDTYFAKSGRLQLIKDKEFKKKFIKKWFDNPQLVMSMSKTDLAYQLALMSAKYEDIITKLTDDFSKAGTYPEWIVKAADERAEIIYGDDSDE